MQPRSRSALHAHDVDGAVACYADAFVYDDRRRLSGDPIDGPSTRCGRRSNASSSSTRTFDLRAWPSVASASHLIWSRCSDDDGNETAILHVREIDDDGRFIYHGRFDEDDFDGAYRELERRYFAGEGAAFAEAAP